MQKKIVIFEGFGSAGKTTLIEKLKKDLDSEFKIEILDNKHPKYASILFSDNEVTSLSKSKYLHFCSRWMRLYLFFDFIINSDSDLFFFGRGILTNYIYGNADHVPEYMIDELINDFLSFIEEKNIIYKTVFIDCDLEIANSRCKHRENIDVNRKIKRNELFASYYLKNISEYYFIKDLAIINTSNSIFEEYEKLIQFIKE